MTGQVWRNLAFSVDSLVLGHLSFALIIPSLLVKEAYHLQRMIALSPWKGAWGLGDSVSGSVTWRRGGKRRLEPGNSGLGEHSCWKGKGREPELAKSQSERVWREERSLQAGVDREPLAPGSALEPRLACR